jgi:hypothetical protein
MNRKGLLNQILIVIVLIVVVMAIVASISLGSIIFPIISGEGIDVAHEIQSSIELAGNSEMTNASEVATSASINVLGTFEFIIYIGFLGLVIGYIMVAYYVRTYPFLAFFWIVGMILIVIFAMIMSNAYEQAKGGDLESFYTTWGSNDLLMSYLPHIMAFVTIIGGIVLFAIVSKDPEAETQML